jgi:hypothetical protein
LIIWRHSSQTSRHCCCFVWPVEEIVAGVWWGGGVSRWLYGGTAWVSHLLQNPSFRVLFFKKTQGLCVSCHWTEGVKGACLLWGELQVFAFLSSVCYLSLFNWLLNFMV